MIYPKAKYFLFRYCFTLPFLLQIYPLPMLASVYNQIAALTSGYLVEGNPSS